MKDDEGIQPPSEAKSRNWRLLRLSLGLALIVGCLSLLTWGKDTLAYWIYWLPILVMLALDVFFWASLITIIVLVVLSVHFRNCPIVKYIGIVMTLLISIPFVAVQIFLLSQREARLNEHFNGAINTDCIVRHKYMLVGWGDTFDFWKLRDVKRSEQQQVIDTFKLEAISDNDLFSMTDSPRWWPKSIEPFSVYEGFDGPYGDTIELWTPKEGSTVYLFRFTE